jgi:hypothetical protein
MGSACKPIRGSGSSVRPFLVVGLLIATVWSESSVVGFLVLSIVLTCALIAAFWEVWRWVIGSPKPPDLCSRCNRGIIARIAVSRRGVRFYRCTICGARYRRESREGIWTDASGLEYDAMYSRPEPGGFGKTVALPVEESIFWTRTVSRLLGNKRNRRITQAAGCGGTIRRSSARRCPSSTARHPSDPGDLWDYELDG